MSIAAPLTDLSSRLNAFNEGQDLPDSEASKRITFKIGNTHKKRALKIVRFQYCSIYARRHWYDLAFGDERLRIIFHERGLDDRWLAMKGDEKLGFRAYTIKSLTAASPSTTVLNWLGVLFGDDMFGRRGRSEDLRPSLRGRLLFSKTYAQTFLHQAYEWQQMQLSDPWKKEVLNAAFGAYHIALAGGLSHTPVSQSTFLTCLETLSNVRNFDPTTHRKSTQKLGPKSFFDRGDEQDRNYLLELEALIGLRNITSAHFGAHQEIERRKLTQKLRNCYAARGHYTPEFLNLTFREDHILDDIQREAWLLYLVSLNLTRLAFGRLINSSGGGFLAEKDLWPSIFDVESAEYLAGGSAG